MVPTGTGREVLTPATVPPARRLAGWHPAANLAATNQGPAAPQTVEAKHMIVVMKAGATRQQIDHAAARIKQLELTPHLIVGTERTVIAIIGDERPVGVEVLESVPGVEKVMRVLAPYKLASAEVRREPTCVPLLGGHSLGGRKIGLIAGPCTVEDRGRLLEVAHAV